LIFLAHKIEARAIIDGKYLFRENTSSERSIKKREHFLTDSNTVLYFFKIGGGTKFVRLSSMKITPIESNVSAT